MAHRPTPLWLKVWRFARLLAHVLQGLLTVTLVFPWIAPAKRAMHVVRWSQKLMARIGIRFETNLPPENIGNPAFYRGAFFAGNHVSWLDIHMLQAVAPARFVAKSELGEWPLVHRMIRASGAMFVERAKRRDVTRINDLLVAGLTAGDCVAVFPEGTTSPGDGLRPFYANLMQAAIDASESASKGASDGAPERASGSASGSAEGRVSERTSQSASVAQEAHAVRLLPFALLFLDGDGRYSIAPAFIGDMNMLQSVWSTLGERRLTAKLVVGAPVPTQGRHRKDVARDAEEAVRALMGFKSGEGVLPRLVPGEQ
jgi:1-acyl-sn-glycerol-3-phosphate acyltransferase